MKHASSHARRNALRILGAALLLLLAAAMAFAYFAFRAETVAGSKSITIEVVNSAGSASLYALRTDAEYLLQAMKETQGLSFSGSEGPYGLMIDTVNGETADFSQDGAYWSFEVNGEYCHYGASEQPVHDGDAFVIAYTR